MCWINYWNMYQGSSSSRSSSSRLGSSRTYEQGEKYMQTLEMRSKKLNAHTRHNLSSLPKLYAKAEELNRKLAASSMLLNYSNSLDGDCRRSSAATPTHHDSSSLDDFDQHNGCVIRSISFVNYFNPIMLLN